MKKNFILFALMVFLPILAFASDGNEKVLNLESWSSNLPTVTLEYNGQDQREGYFTVKVRRGNGDIVACSQYQIFPNGTTSSTWNPQAVTEMKNAGTYIVRGRRSGSNSYYWGKVIIKKRTLSADDFDDIEYSTYDGKDYKPAPEPLENTLLASDIVCTYKDVAGESLNNYTPNAGYKAVLITPNSNNVQLAEGTSALQLPYEIDKMEIAVEDLVADFTGALPYNGTDQSGNITVTVTRSAPAPQGAKVRRASITNEGMVTFTGADFTNIKWYQIENQARVEKVLKDAGVYVPTITFAAQDNYTFTKNGNAVNGALVWESEDELTIQRKDISSADVTPSALIYNGTPQVPGEGSVVVKDGANELEYGVDFTTSLATQGGGTHIGEYTFDVIGQGNYTGTKTGIPYSIVKKAIVINAAQIWKWYGEDDSEAKRTTGELANYVDFTIDGNSIVSTLQPSEKTHILSFLEFARANGDNGEDAGDHDYMIVAKPNMEECDFAITIQHNTSKMVIHPAEVTVHVAQNTKVYATADPDFLADKQISTNPVAYDYFWIKNADGEIITTNNANPKLNAKDYVDETKDLKTVLNIGREPGQDVGEYEFTWNNPNYNVTFVNDNQEPAVFTITGADGNITVQDVVYKGSAWEPVIVKDDEGKVLVKGTDYDIEYRNNVNAGEASYYITYKGNYSGTESGIFNIKKKEMHITAVSYTKPLGYEFNQNDVNIVFTQSDFVTGESASVFANDVNYRKPKTQLAAVTDPAKIKIEFVKENNHYGNSTNYEFVPSTTDGYLYIGRPVLLITAQAQKVYGAQDPDLSKLPLLTEQEANAGKDGIIVSGWAKNESKTAQENFLKLNGSSYFFEMTREEGENVDDYDIEFEGPTAVGQEGDGYAIQYLDGTFTITKADLTITALSDEKTYGEADPNPWPIDVVGLKNGDTKEDLLYGTWQWGYITITQPTYTVTRQDGENVGVYNLTGIAPSLFAPLNETLQNYNVTWKYTTKVNGVDKANTLTIKPFEITIKVADAEITYGSAYEPNIQVESPTNLGNRTNAAIIAAIKASTNPALKYTGIPTATPIEVKEGGYQIGATGPATVLNYKVTAYNPGTLTVLPYELDVLANDQAIAYDGEYNPYYLTINGTNYEAIAKAQMAEAGELKLPTGDKLSEVLALESTATKVGPNKDAYTLKTDKAKSGNYTFDSFVNGYLTIDPLPYLPLEETVLAQFTDNKLSQVIKDHDGVTLDVYLPQRGMFMEQWYAFVLPFSFRASEFAKVVQYEVINMLDESNENDGFNFQIAAGEIPANTPFLVQIADDNLKGADMVKIKFASKKIVYSENLTVANKNGEGDYKFTGTYDSFTGFTAANGFDDADTQYAVYRNYSNPSETNKPGFYNGTATSKVNETEAFLELPSSVQLADVRIVVEDGNGNPTAINGVIEEAAEVAAEGWYTITGVKLDAQPSAPGTYIFNGKKVYIK